MKGSRFTKFICLLLSVMMVLMLLPGSTLADVTNETSSDESEQVAVTDGDAEETEEAEEPEQDEAALEALEEEESEEPVILYTVNFYVEKDLFETQLIEAGGTASPATPSTPNKEEYAGMEFLYWYVSNEDVKFYLDTPITDHLDLHAHFGVAETEEPVAKSAALGTILPEGTFLKTYIFTVNGSQWGDTQIVATGDTLNEPATPTAAAGMRFAGWYTSGDVLFDSFGTQTVEETTTVTLHAVFVTAYYAFFYNAAGTAILETREPDGSNQVSTTNVTALQVAVDEAVTGWSYTMGGSAVGDTIIVSGTNVNLFPIIEKVKWVSFNSNGGTYVSPMHVAPNTTLTAAMVATYVDSQVTGTVITRAGYTFSAWSGFTFGTIVTSDITLNASWTANTNTPYTLVYWTQNADDAEYSFEKTVAKTGTSGAVISPTTAELAATNLNSNYSAYFNNGTTAGGQTINGDGSSIVNIYHTRRTYTLTFKNTSNTTIYTQTYKYDQDVTAVWDVTAIKTLSNQGYVWESSITQAYYTFLQKMPGSNLTMTATHWQGSTYTWYYYLETLDGTAATAPAGSTTTTNGGITYYLYRTSIIVGTGISLTYAEDYFPITGFYQRDNTVPSFERTGNKYYASLFYRCSSYNLAFINGDTTNTISSIKYEASIEGQYYEPTKPTGVPTNFVFTGWYTTEGGYAGSEFTWTGATMPAKNLVLYAVWKAPTFTGIAHLTVYGTGGGTYDLGTIPYGGTISSSALNAAREEADLYKPNTTDTFGGWLIDRGGSRTLFNANMQIYEDVVLYPQWISGVSYHVTYNLSGATGNLPADLSSYGVGAKAVVLDIDSTVVAPTGKVFTGWRVGTTGPVYYPGSAVTISGNTTLYAVWSDTASLVSITYDGNGNNSPAASSTHTVPVVNNTIHHVLGGNLFTYTGKEFVEWNTFANGLGTGYDPNDPALISASQPSSPTTLYAIWRTATYTVSASVTPSDKGSITEGTGTFDFGADTIVRWSVDPGYAVSSVTDNSVPVSVTGNFYTLNDLSSNHTIVVTLTKTSFNLTYNGNGGMSGGSGSHSSTLTIGDPYIVEANTFTNAGHYFVGWSTTSGGPAESAYAPGTNHDMPAADVTLYAIWADKMDLVLTANSVALNYNEEAQSVTGFTGNISGLTYGGTTTAGASGTNPGQYTATFTGQTNLVILQSGTDVTDRYTVSFVNGTLTINPKVSYINGATGAQYAYEWVDYGTGDASYSLAPDQNVTVGTVNYYWTGTWDFPAANNLIANKTITALYATNKQLTITGNSDIVTYDGNGHLIEEATLSDPDLTVSGYTVSGSGTNAGTYDVLVTLGPSFKIMSGTTDVTYQYDVSTAKGTLTINPATLTVTAVDKSIIYPAARPDVTTLNYTASGNISGETPAFTGILGYVSTLETNPLPGPYTDVIVQGGLLLADNGAFKASNYTIDFVEGDLNVTSGTFSVSLTGTSAEYDGGAHSATLNGTQSGDGIQYFVREGGIWVPVSYTPSVTNVNDGPKEIKVIVSRTGYTNAEATATLTITPATLTVSAVDKTITYPANRPLEASLNYTAVGNVAGETPAYTGELAYQTGFAVQPAAGPHNDVIEQGYLALTDNGTFKASNYSLSFVKGDLTVLAGTFTPTSAGYIGTYDGDEHGLTADVPGVTGETIWYSTSPDGPFSETPPTFTDAGTYTVYFKATDPAHNYNDSAVYSGQVVINPADLVVAAIDVEITYPESRPAESTLDYYTVSGIAESEVPYFEGILAYKSGFDLIPSTGPHTDVIEQGSLVLADAGTFKASNYTLVFDKGNVTVLAGTMTPTSSGYLGTYDGVPHGLTADVPGVTGETIWYSTSPDGPFSTTPPTFTDAGTYMVYFKATDPLHNYNDSSVQSGTVTINPATLTVTAVDKSIIYPAARPDEAALNYTVAGEIGTEVAAFTGILGYASTLETNPLPGPYADVIVQGGLLLDDNGTFKASNYTIDFVEGDLSVTSGTFSVSLTDLTAVYSGIAHSATLNGSVSGDVIAYSYYNGSTWVSTGAVAPSVTNVSDGPLQIKVVVSRTGYEDATATGTLTITPATLTVTANSPWITYPASRPAEASLTYYASSGTIDDETPAYTGTLAYQSGLATNPTPGTHIDAIEQGNLALATSGAFLASNYTLSFVKGNLTVIPGTMTPTSAGYLGTYDGAPHGLTADVVGVSGETIWYSTSPDGPFSTTPPTFKNAGTYTVYFKATDPAHNYNDSAVLSGTVVINPRTLTVTANSPWITYPASRPAEASLTYYASSGTITGETPAYTGTLAYQSGLATNPTPGTHIDAIEQGNLALATSGAFLASNYTLSFVKGNLTVIPGTMTPTSAGYLGTYDGAPHGLTADVVGVSGETIWYSTSPDGPFSTTPPTFTNAGTYTVYFKATDPAHNYNDSAVYSGQVIINKATLTVTAVDKSVIYPAARPDEATLNYTVSGEIGSEDAAFTGILGYVSTLETNPLPGPYTDVIVQGGLLLADNGTFKASNYTIDFVEGDLNVTSGTFSVSLTGTSAEYDGGAHSATLNGTQSGDGIQYFVREGGVWIPVSYTPSVTNVNDGPKEIKVIVSRTGYSNAEATATLTITPVEVTVTADSRSMTFGNTTTLTPAEGVTYAGFVNSETSSVVSGAGTINYTYRQGATVVTVDNDLPVGSYSITPNIGGLTATNYTFVPGSGTLAVGIATMTVGSLGYNGTYDGDPHDLVATASIDGMTILYSATEGSGYSEDCPSYTNAGTYTVYFKAVDPDGNYADATGSADIVITKAVLTVTADDRSMTYGDMASLTAEGASYSGFADGDSLSNIGMTGSVTFGYFAGATSVTVDATLGAGGYTIKPNVSALSSANYTFTPGNGTLTVNKAIMTVGAIDVTHVYDGTAYSVIANAIPDDPNTVIYYNTTGGTMLSDYFEEIPEAIDVADSTRVYFLAVNPNYEDATGSAMLTITPAVITVTADNRSMTYGDTTTLTPAEGVTYAGFVNSETSSVISDAGSITYTYQEGAALVTVDNTLDAGGYSIIPGVGGLSAANYSFVPGNGTLTVNRATGLAINATSYNEKYDGGEHGIGTSPTPAEGTTLLYSLTGGTNLSAYTLTSNPMFKNAMSAKTVYVAAVNDNYVTVFDQATVTIARRTIKLASDSETRPYNGSPLSLPDVAVTGDGFVTGEGFVTDPQSTVSITNVSSVTNAYSYPAFIPGTNVDNYAFQKTEGTLEITAVEVTVTADDQSMTYGDSSATPAAGVSYSGFVNSETASVVSGTVGYNYYDGATEVFIGSTLGAGSYDITPDLSGITATNYTFKAADGTLTVNPATMEVTSDGYNELYDGAPHGLEAEVTGLTGMTITYSDSVTGTFTNASPEYTNVGTYTVYFKAVDPDGNYADATGSAQIIIRKVQVTVTADNRIMTYGDTTTMTPAEGVTYAGFVNGENATSAGVTGLVNYYYYDSLWELVGVSNTLDAGIYTIKPSVFWLSAANYTFVPADGTLTVNKATMTVDSSGTLAVYDGFPYDLTATASVDGMTILYSATADGTYGSVCPSYTNAGTYTVYFKAIDPDGNYAEATGHADIVITKAVLTVRAIDRSMTYGDMSSLTVEDASFSGFAFGDNLSNIGLTGSVGYYYFDSATLVTVDATLDAGSYTITPYVGSLNSANYTFVPADGTLTVSPATMEVTSLGYEDYYDGAAHGLTASVTGLSGMTITYSDSPSGTFTSASPEYTNAGTYTVYFKAVDPDGNYADATGSAEINIRQVEVTVTADDQNMMYGDTTAPAETVSYSGFVNGENATSAGVTGDVLYSYYDSLMYMVAVSSTLDAGLYTITPDVGGLSATNYSFVPADGTLTVAKSDALDVSADDVEAPYDGFPYMVSPNVNDWNGTDVWYSLTDSTDPADYSMTPPSLVNVGDSARVYLMATNLNYENAFGSALVTITPVELTVTPDDQYMIYGDTTLPAESSVITGFVNGENETTAGVSGSIDYNYFDGTTPVTVSSTLPAGDYTIEVGLSNLTAPNYTFTNASGALNVARSESLTVDATDISEMYNGGTHMVTPLASDMSADTTIWYSLTDSTDPADYSTTPPALVNVSDSATVYLMATNPNYYPAFGEAEVDITPRTIAIVTNGANKVYDATPLTDNGWSLGAGNDGFASTEGFLSAEAVGTITNAGFVFNTFDYTLTSNTLPGNYDFDITEGVLIISARPVIVALDPAEKNSGDPDPAFTFHYLTFPGLYDVLPGTGATVNLIRTDALAVTSEDIGVHTDVLSINVVFADATAASNYAIVPQNADFTIHPQVTYNLDTLDAVTGFPATEWFDYLSDATIADATGVARLGYVLTGWTDDLTGDPIALGETITGIDRNYSLTAVWELARYNVFYNANTAMDVNNMPGTQVNIPYTSLTALSDRVPTRAGFTFVHWDTAEVPGQISYDPGETFTMPNSDVTFSAVWEPDLTPVYYHANGGVGGTIEDGPFGTLTTVTVAGNGFTRPGYRFIGWSTTPTGAVSAQPGDTFMMPILQVNYYAQWEQVLYTVTYIVNGGTTAGLDGAVPYAEYTDLAYGDAMPVPADPAQDGYTFAGWTTAVPATVPEGGLTIYGTMTENTPEIIPDEPTPLAGASWALLNLILAIATALGSVLMLIGLIGKKRKEELEGVVVRETKKHPVTRLMTLLPAIGGIIAFILTENMKNPMTFVDRWTILMAVIAVLQIALVILGVKKDKEVDPESAK